MCTIIMMKPIILVLLSCRMAFSAKDCCPGKQIIRNRGYCGDDPNRININCTIGHMLLKDIVLSGNKVSTLDSPGYVFTEDPEQYCVGEMYRNSSYPELGNIPVAVVCFQEVSSSDVEASGILTLISTVFLVITFAVYMYLPQMRDLQGLCYMCMCISMALGFLCLGILQLNHGFINQLCTVTGFLVYFWMMATFFWMNVICINMYRTVQDSSYLKLTESKQYFIYNCYAWGCTILFLIVSLIANFVDGDHWSPGIGPGSCWFQGRTETWIYFYGPIALIITANVILFIMSSYSLWRQTKKYDVNKLNNLKHKFLLSLKLFLVMGITWVFEVLSFAHGGAHIIWDIMDTFNCLQGVVIFLLLVVLRRRAIQGLVAVGFCTTVTRPLAELLSPHDDAYDERMLPDENAEVRLN